MKKSQRQQEKEDHEEFIRRCKMSDRELLDYYLNDEKIYLEKDKDLYLEYLGTTLSERKPLTDDRSIRDGLLLFGLYVRSKTRNDI